MPETVRRALEEYRALLAAHGPTWGEDPIHYVRQLEVAPFVPDEREYFVAWFLKAVECAEGSTGPHIEAALNSVDMHEILRDVLGGALPDNLAALRLTPDGAHVEARPRPVFAAGARHTTTLLLDSSRDEDARVEIDGVVHDLTPGGAVLVPIASDSKVVVDDVFVSLDAVTRQVAVARLRVRAGMPCRWTVVGDDGHGWYPPDAPDRHDAHAQPYFHGDDIVLDVPAEPLTILVTRGAEYEIAEVRVHPAPDEELTVELTPRRRYDAPARGWYGGDMHVHMNWAGNSVGTPEQAAAIQQGEDLHVLNLVAGNVSGVRVYDREALEHWAGRDAPWSTPRHIARLGVEYRNDLLGHLYAFGMDRPPELYHTGFLGSDDWPPNAEGIRGLTARGAIVGYSHPFHLAVSEDGEPSEALSDGRNCSAREIVADAALGLVHSLDVLNHSDVHATARVYRRLVGAGNRLAVTAGSDTQISFTRRGNQSSPPGWERVYARVDGDLTAASFADAIRRGRTFATTGPWLELDVDGHGPGDTLDLPEPGGTVTATVRVVGEEVETVQLLTSDGVLAEGPPDELTVRLAVSEPIYVIAVAVGQEHVRSMHRSGVYAQTSPVHVHVAGRHVAREDDVRWCLAYLDGFERMIRDRARLSDDLRLADHISLIEAARTVYRDRLG
ncbi:CehA/McbA family metallohydrolase [Actinomadura oligospora]|uniref:CehA/McbA family metallohydrolase n=1 Tax=Actinomadura oligospora TaxID=111804 RepID=UPI000A03018C|nr:CehA/McbA family metallohydrolase [Actinomadura oligospora]